VDLDARHATTTGGDGQGHALKQREIDRDVQSFRLESGESVGNGGQLLADRLQIVQRFVEAKVLEVIAQCFQAEEGRELRLALAFFR
jgi:hypothetical protein